MRRNRAILFQSNRNSPARRAQCNRAGATVALPKDFKVLRKRRNVLRHEHVEQNIARMNVHSLKYGPKKRVFCHSNSCANPCVNQAHLSEAGREAAHAH